MAVLETPRLILRPFRKDDLELLAELMANVDFMRFSLGPQSREKTAEVLDKMQSRDRAGEPSQFAVILQATEQLIGFCGFFGQNVDGVERSEIGYRFHPDYWGQELPPKRRSRSVTTRSRFSSSIRSSR